MIAYNKDANGRYEVNTEGAVVPAKQGDVDAVVNRNHYGRIYPKVGDTFAVKVFINNQLYSTIASGTAAAEVDKLCCIEVKVRAESDADIPSDPTDEVA